jgi:hypothetical protein
MSYLCTCTYCGYKWLQIYVGAKAPVCQKCGDKNIRVQKPDDEDRDPFGYNK